MTRRLIAFAVMALWLVAMVPVAKADTGDIIEPQNDPPTAADGWQAATCTTDTPKCSPAEPNYFLQAGGHPPVGYTQYIIRHTTVAPGLVEPLVEPLEGRAIQTLRVDLPPGLTVNPQATEHEQCSLTDFLNQPTPGTFVPACSATTKVGEEQANLVTNKANVEFPPGSSNIIANKGTRLPLIPGVFQVPVYNLVPKGIEAGKEQGEPALFGFVVAGKEPVFLETEVAWESDYHESFTIHLHPASSSELQTIISRLVNFGDKTKTGNGTYITNPTTCFNPAEWPHLYSTWYRAHSYEEPDPVFPNGSTPFEAKVEGSSGTLFQQEGCDAVPFTPTVDVAPGTTAVDSPAPADAITKVPFEVPKTGGNDISQSHLRSAKVTLPAGMGLNPAGANGLVACTDAEFKKGQRVVNNICPSNSKIGTIEIETPPLPAGSLKGDIYVGEQKSSDPTSGEEFRILAEAKSARYGVVVRLVGNTSANPTTGQLTTTFDEQEVGPLAGKLPRGLPQAPFESVALHFSGPHLVLTSPPTCSAANTSGQMEPWARPETQVATPPTSFTLSSIPGGGTCPATLAARPFAPSYTAKTDSTKANGYSPFRVHIGRPDGQQELKLVNVTLPKGHAANLTGVPYCSESALAAAAASTGKAQQANPSCSSTSQIGTATTLSGTGPNPAKIDGKAYLAGPYRGAPLSLAIITPAVQGPFDLGTVVVRVALFVNPETAQVNAVSDAIPDVFGGVKLDIRSIDVNVDRTKFMHNPTNCSAQATTGFLNGGGANPADPAAWSSYAVNSPFQASECNKLGFKPKLFTRLFAKGSTNRGKHPKLRAILEAREGDANIQRNAVSLPHALFLDQGNIRTVCTRPQLASQTCPKASIYGHAEARTPLLENKLKGPVYLVSSNHELPDLLANLRGQVNIQVRGVISSKNGGIKTVFNNLPDVPVKKFILRMEGGKKKGLLVNSRGLCKGPLSSVMSMKGQNGKKIKNNHLPLKVSGC
jgi:hypothetical protein